MAIPLGVTAGANTVNLINCKVNSSGPRANGIDVQGTGTPVPVTMVIRACNVVGTGTPFYNTAVLVGQDDEDPAHTFVCDSVYHSGFRHWTYYLDGSTFTTEIHGTDAASYGTSQYVANSAPVPTTRLREVGTGKTYSTVMAAYAAANHGDNIVIYPGTYDCTEFNRIDTNILKCVRFYGSTEDPDDVILTIDGGTLAYGAHGFCFVPGAMTNVPEDHRAPGMLHLTITRTDTDNWENPFGAWWDASMEDSNPWLPDTPANALMFSCNT